MDRNYQEETPAATDEIATGAEAIAEVASNDISYVNGLSPQEAAVEYIRRGWSPIPLEFKTKKGSDGWPNLRLIEAQVPQYFGNGRCNIGVLTGEPSVGLVDVDLDCHEAVAWAPRVFRTAQTAFGRKSKPRSHLLYRCPEFTESKKFQFGGDTLLELRANGHQTMFPPSVHPSGEQVLWAEYGEVVEISADRLLAAAGQLAAAILLVRNWPEQGGRNDAASALCGMLLRDERYNVEMVKTFVTFIAHHGGDRDWRERESIAGRMEKALENGKKATGLPMMRKIFGTDVANQVHEWLGLKKEKKARKSDVLANMLSEIELWHSEDRQAFATIPVNEHVEHHRIEGKSFKEWLQWRAFQETGKAAPSTALNEIIGTAAAKAKFDGEQHRTWLRVGELGDKLYLDLGDDNWTVVEIDADGWRICDASKIKLRRGGGNALPLPERGGSIEELRPFINVESESDFQLLVGFLVTCFRPGRSFPILSLAGEQGSAKTTTLKIIRSLIDPAPAAARSLPKSEDDLVVTANNNWLMTADNISSFNAEMADALCRLATGGGIAKRELYTNGEEFKIDAHRPIVLNGINQLTERQDFLDRSVVITLARIEDDQRRDERSFWADYEKVRPRILGALLDAVVVAIQRLPEIGFETLPRMSDFALWSEASGPAFGWTEGSFLKTYEHMRDGLMEKSARSDPMSDIIYDWLLATGKPFCGTATKLLQDLEAYVIAIGRERVRELQEWPKNSSRLARRLRQKAAGLRALGIEYDEKHDSKANTAIYLLSLPGIPDGDEPPF